MYNKDIVESVICLAKAYMYSSPLTEIELNQFHSLNATEFHQYTNIHKIGPLCYNILQPYKAQIPQEIFQPLRKKAHAVAFRNMVMYGESKEIKDKFSREGVPILVYKGHHFTDLFYKNYSLRSSVDIDFAIGLNDLSKSSEIMKQLGYQEIKGTIDKEKVKQSRSYYLDYPWQKELKNGRNVYVEFHLAPAHKALFVPLDFSDFLNDKHNTSENGGDDFSAIQHALFILIHHGAVDIWGKLMHLIDLYQILKVLNKEEVEEFVTLCDKYRVRGFLNIGLCLLSSIFGKHYPDIMPAESSKRLLQQIADDCLQGNLAGKWSENRKKINYHLRLRDSLKDQVLCIQSLMRYAIFQSMGI